MHEPAYEGGCLCGALRYRISGAPLLAEYCHCGMCRKVSGAPVVAWMDVGTEQLQWIQGAPKLYQSSPGIFRGFCADCGSTLTYQRGEAPPKFTIALGSLDHAEAVAPAQHIFTANALPWLHISDDLPKYAQYSPTGAPMPQPEE